MVFDTIRRAFPGLLGVVLLGCVGRPALPDTTLPNATPNAGTGVPFHDGVVTASEPLAAEVGAQILADGGNAVDAAVAVMFMLAVVEPQSSGIGGGGFMMFHLAGWPAETSARAGRPAETFYLDCRERAPAATTADMFVSQPDFALRSSSGYAVGVPGEVACAAMALENWGTMTLAEVLQPAIAAAKQGIVVSTRLAADLQLPTLGYDVEPLANPVFRPNGTPLEAGERLVQPALAHTLERIAEGGRDAFYRCDHEAGIARAIVETQKITRTSNPDGVGRMTCADLESYEVRILEPLSATYRGYEILTMPPPSSGGIALLQMLGMLEGFPIGDDRAGFGFGDFATLDVMLEAMQLAFADRARWVGDEGCATCADVPVTGLLADAYLEQRAARIEVGKRLGGVPAGDPRPYDPGCADERRLALDLPVSANESTDTTHFVVVDDDGNIVNATMTIEATWGTGLTVPGYGFLLNNELTDFNPVPTYNPDPLNFDPGANDPAPGKTPRSSMAPTMIFLGGEPVAAYGAPGGASIINALLNFTLDLVDHRMTLWESVRAPRINLPTPADSGVAEREAGFDPAVLLALQAIGYSFVEVPAISAVQAILMIPGTGRQYGAADPRRIGGVAAPNERLTRSVEAAAARPASGRGRGRRPRP